MARTFPKSGYNPVTGEWNDSLKGDYCWSSVNYREAAPDVMTPITWSLLWIYVSVTDPVVGCGNATTLLKTGDRVRVDGGRGMVEILSR